MPLENGGMEMPDRTTDIERDVVSTQKPALKNLVRMWIYVVKNSKTIALLYLGLYVLHVI